MANKMLPKDVADAFVKQYYVILDKSPENAYKFYQESSLLGWPGPDGVITPVTTLNAIGDKIMSSNHKDGKVEIKTVDAQDSLNGAVIVAVTGTVTAKDGDKKHFSQTFVLAKQEKGFFVLNDIFRQIDIPAASPNAESAVVEEPSVEPPSDDTSVLNAKPVDENKADDVVKAPVAKDTSAAAPVDGAEKPSSPSAEKAMKPVVAPSLKISYASVVAKERPPSPPKASTPTSNGPARASSPRATAMQRSPRTGNGASNGNVAANGNANANANATGPRGIYIGRLPYDITKQGIMDVVKQFGPLRRNSDSVQIRRHEDGFCCGFVDFEYTDSAHRAVEVHRVHFGGNEDSYISYKRSHRGANDVRRSLQTGGGFQRNNFKSWENDSRRVGRFQNGNQSPRGRGQSSPRDSTQ